MTIGPAPVLAAIVGGFHVSAYVFIRGRAGTRLPFLLAAAILGAWAGDAVGSRLGDPVTIGDFHLLAASFVAWLGIGLVAILAVLVPERPPDAARRWTLGRRLLAAADVSRRRREDPRADDAVDPPAPGLGDREAAP